MRVTVLAVGKLKEKWLHQGVAEYERRLRRLAQVKVVEIPDQPCPSGQAEQAQALQREGAQILAKLNPRSFVIALDVQGKSLDSPGLARLISEINLGGTSDLTFIIGGSLGLSPEVLARTDLRLSFSAFTFPHQLMRLILLEQIYRACKINAGEVYHK